MGLRCPKLARINDLLKYLQFYLNVKIKSARPGVVKKKKNFCKISLFPQTRFNRRITFGVLADYKLTWQVTRMNIAGRSLVLKIQISRIAGL